MKAAGGQSARRIDDEGAMEPEFGPTRGPQDKDRQVAPLEALLVLKMFVRRYKEIKASCFGGGEERAVLKVRPSALVRRFDTRRGERSTKWRWRALIEKDFQDDLRRNS
jgi:hypothetical protein